MTLTTASYELKSASHHEQLFEQQNVLEPTIIRAKIQGLVNPDAEVVGDSADDLDGVVHGEVVVLHVVSVYGHRKI